MTTPRIVHVLTVADSLLFIDTVVKRARESGFEVVVVTSPDERLNAFGRKLGVQTIGVEMPRRVSPAQDWESLQALHRLFVRLRPTLVHSHTPKGGLLGTLAAEAAGVPVRLYQMRGLAYVTAREPLRTVLLTTERVTIASATHVICQSRSLRSEALTAGLVTEANSQVVLEGSNGVDAERFAPNEALGARLRLELKIPAAAPVIGFVGRLVRDKGIPELVEAFSRLDFPEAHLILAGPYEPRDPVDETTRARISAHPRIHALGPVKDPRDVYAASDFVVLPSHREGFPNVPLEAAAMGKAVITTRVSGCVDAIADGTTGQLVSVNAPVDLRAAFERYLSDPALAQKHGVAGRERVISRFSRDQVAKAMVEVYRRHMSGI